MDFTITQSLEQNDEFFELLHQSIREFNNMHSVFHKQSREPGAIKPLHLMVETPDHQRIGGLTGEMYWDWLEIRYLYLRDGFRRHGIGQQLLAKAEETAKAAGCTKVFLTTFEFQARTFYERCGYKVAGTLEGYPPGSAYYWMVKELQP